jgi:hypothetical protein
MRLGRIRHLVVVHDDGALAGILSQRDLLLLGAFLLNRSDFLRRHVRVERTIFRFDKPLLSKCSTGG